MRTIRESYLIQRRAIGIMAMALGALLILGAQTGGASPIGVSISSYAWANDHAIFDAVLAICGSFLIFYSGFDTTDNVITSLAGVSFILVVLFPCIGGNGYTFLFLSPRTTSIIHGGAAAVGFALLGHMSLVQFPKSSGEETENKRARNIVYRTCGVIIFASIGAIGIITIIPGAREYTDKIRLFLSLELIILGAFGISWLTKGQSIFPDEKEKEDLS
jgi:hypothetical protein